MISSDIIRGYNDTIILSILERNPSYGYEISKTIKEQSKGQYIIKETTLYSAFSRLEKNGYIDPFVDAQSTNRRTYYRITKSGSAYLKLKKEEWLLTQDVINAFIHL